MPLDFTALKTFKVVAEQASVTNAANILHCVPSAVTTRIRQLENELGQKLLVRSAKGMVLTPAGRVLMPYAQKAVSLIDETEKAIRQDEEPRGTLCVGATDTAATIYLPSVFATYHETFPNVQFEITSSVTTELIELVKDHSLDCAIINTQVEDPLFNCELVRTERLVIASARSVSAPFKDKEVTFLAARAGGAQRKRIEDWWRTEDYPPMRITELPSLGLRLSFAAAGIGITVVPLSAIEKLAIRDSVRLHAIPEPWCWQDTILISRKDSPSFAARKHFRSILHEFFDNSVNDSLSENRHKHLPEI